MVSGSSKPLKMVGTVCEGNSILWVAGSKTVSSLSFMFFVTVLRLKEDNMSG